MRKFSILSVFIFFLVLAQEAAAGEFRKIELKDGSVVIGRVTSFSGGIYTIESQTLGTIKIEDSNIKSIRSKSPGKNLEEDSGDNNILDQNQIQSLQKQMMNDQGIMGMILDLRNDPEFQKILQDPAITQAITSGDISTLMSNPKFMDLLNNSTVKGISRKLME